MGGAGNINSQVIKRVETIICSVYNLKKETKQGSWKVVVVTICVSIVRGAWMPQNSFSFQSC